MELTKFSPELRFKAFWEFKTYVSFFEAKYLLFEGDLKLRRLCSKQGTYFHRIWRGPLPLSPSEDTSFMDSLLLKPVVKNCLTALRATQLSIPLNKLPWFCCHCTSVLTKSKCSFPFVSLWFISRCNLNSWHSVTLKSHLSQQYWRYAEKIFSFSSSLLIWKKIKY